MEMFWIDSDSHSETVLLNAKSGTTCNHLTTDQGATNHCLKTPVYYLTVHMVCCGGNHAKALKWQGVASSSLIKWNVFIYSSRCSQIFSAGSSQFLNEINAECSVKDILPKMTCSTDSGGHNFVYWPALFVCSLKKMPQSMPEYALTRNYLELMVDLPWSKSTKGESFIYFYSYINI